jgi:hypothetical protein
MKAKAAKGKGKHSNSSKRGAKIAAGRRAEGMEIVHPHAGGIDYGAQEHYVAVPPQSVESGEPFVRCFSAAPTITRPRLSSASGIRVRRPGRARWCS